MRHDLIKTDNYLLVVDNNTPRDGQYVLPDSKIPTQYREMYEGEVPLKCWKKIIAHLPLKKARCLYGVPVLPSLPQEDGAEEIFPVGKHGVMHMPNRHQLDNSLRQEGYNKAREKYKWTDNDLKASFTHCAKYAAMCLSNNLDADFNAEWEKYFENIQSLQQPIPVAFECEMEPEYKYIGAVKGVKGSGNKIKNNNAVKPKTITNAEGTTEWLGKYIYE